MFLFLLGLEGYCQTFTFNGGTGCTFTSGGTCWTRSNPDGCNGSSQATSISNSIFSKTSGCPINLIINSNLTIAGEIAIGGIFNSITVNTGAVLTFTGNIDIEKETEIDFITNGGIIEILGANGITIKNGSQSGGQNPVTNYTKLNISGNGQGSVKLKNLNINQYAQLNILENGGFVVSQDTKYAGNSSQINVSGKFVTTGLQISGGGKGVELNAFGNAIVEIKGNVDITGESTISFGGSSTVRVDGDLRITGNSDPISMTGGLFLTESTTLSVGGNVTVTGNAILKMEDTAEATITGSIYLKGSGELNMSESSILIVEGGCGTFEDVNCQGGLFVEGSAEFIETGTSEAYICGQKPIQNTDTGASVTTYCDPNNPSLIPGVNCAIYSSCRTLPVEYLETKVHFEPALRIAKVNFTTAKEWENSHFEIERSINDARNWIKMGEITGKGYSDVPVNYNFIDLNLPAAGGNIFYRLKQVDLDGDFQYSRTQAIHIDAVKGSTAWRAYPNPSIIGSSITLALIDKSGYAEGKIQITLSDFRGITQTYTVSKPEEVSAVVNSHLEKERPGMYIAQLFWGDKSEQLKLIRK